MKKVITIIITVFSINTLFAQRQITVSNSSITGINSVFNKSIGQCPSEILKLNTSNTITSDSIKFKDFSVWNNTEIFGIDNLSSAGQYVQRIIKKDLNDINGDAIEVISSTTLLNSGGADPSRIFIDKYKNIYLRYYSSGQIRKWSPPYISSTVVVNNFGSNFESDFVVDSLGVVYGTRTCLCDNSIEKWVNNPDLPIVIIQGTGTGQGSILKHPSGIVLDSDNNLIIADKQDGSIKKVLTNTNSIVTLKTGLTYPSDVFINHNSEYFIVEGCDPIGFGSGSKRIRKFDKNGNFMMTIAENLNCPYNIGGDSTGKVFFRDFTETYMYQPSSTMSLSNDTTILQGDSAKITLNFNGIGPYSFSMNDSLFNNINQNPFEIKVSPSTSKTYTFEAFSSICGNGQILTDDEVEIIVIPCDAVAPVLSIGDTTLCKGDSLLVSANGCLNGTIIWSNSHFGSSQIIYPTQTITLSAYCQSSNGCLSTNSTFNITVYEKPYVFANTTNLCVDSTITLHARGISNTTKLQWFKDGIKLLGATDSLISVTTSGNYTVGVMDFNKEYEFENLPISGANFSSFFNSQLGLVVTGDSIYKTTNGGKNWVNYETPAYFTKIQFVSSDIIYASGYYEMFKSNDGGITWSSNILSQNSAYIQDFDFANTLNGWVVVENAQLFRTIDGGNNWNVNSLRAQIVGSPYGYVSYSAVDFKDSTNGLISFYVGDSSYVFNSMNGGSVWSSPNGVTKFVEKIQFIESTNAFLNGYDFMKSNNSGNSWTKIQNISRLRDFSFYSPKVGVIGDFNGDIYLTTDSCLSWRKLNMESFLTINSIEFLSNNEGVVIGNGFIKHFKPKLYMFCESLPKEIQSNIEAPQITTLSQTICMGETVSISATGCSGGTIKWNNNQIGSTITVQPVLNTSYRVICQLNSCTSDSSNVLIVTVKPKSFSTISVVQCDKFMSPSGKFTYTTSGIHKDTLNNSVGCDSIITINLTIKRSTYSTTTLSKCESYISPSGRFTWTTSGIYKDTIANAVGCDSIITINLNIIKKAEAIISGNKIISTGQSATLSVTVSGTAPYTLAVNGIVYSNINEQNFSFNVSPTQTTTFAISSVMNNTCGIGTWSGSAIVTVDSNNPCPSVREIPVGNAVSGIYKAAEVVKSVANVASPTSYIGGKSIELMPGFKAEQGILFQAQIGGCP